MSGNYIKDVVTLALRRNKDSLEGKFIEYIKSGNTVGSQEFLKAAMAYYLPLYLLESGENPEKHKLMVLDAISDLELQIIKIKRLYNLEHLSQVMLISPPGLSGEAGQMSQNNSSSSVSALETGDEEDDEDDEDDDPIAMAISKSNVNLDAGFRVD
ncbi:MAG: hypothetical protein KME64_41320 [Scytonematopsis contorta HA4267-MV1]|nr:hypothetical protein [Scytonematopsis contorta HA4267-MV1]